MLIEYKIESTKDSLSIKWLEFSAFGMLAGIQSMLGKDDPARQPARPKKKKKNWLRCEQQLLAIIVQKIYDINYISYRKVVLEVKNPPANAGDSRNMGSIPESENGNTLQYHCLENSMERGAWQAIVCGAARVRLK